MFAAEEQKVPRRSRPGPSRPKDAHRPIPARRTIALRHDIAGLHRLIVQFAQACAGRANGEHQRMRLEPPSLQYRNGRSRGRKHDIAGSSFFNRNARAPTSSASRSAFAGFRLQMRIVFHLRPHMPERLNVRPRLHARADNAKARAARTQSAAVQCRRTLRQTQPPSASR